MSKGIRLRLLRGATSETEKLMAQANQAIEEIEQAGGEYVDLRLSVAGPSSGGALVTTLAIVYKERQQKRNPHTGSGAKIRTF